MKIRQISDKEYLAAIQKANQVKPASITEAANLEADRKIHDQNKLLREAALNTTIVNKKWSDFCNDVKQSLLSECIYGLMEDAFFYQHDKARAELIGRNVVNNYIKEQGATTLLKRFESKSYVLSEFARVIEESTQRILEKCDKSKPDTFCIDMEDRDEFFNNLKSNDADEVATAIKMRVSDAIDKFIQDGKDQRSELEDILTQTQEKIDGAKTENMKESYNMLGKRKMYVSKMKKKKSVLETMVYNLASKSFTNQALKEAYCKDNKLDMDSIVENCTVLYAFLETLNTAKIENVNEAFIIKTLKEM